MSLITLLDAHLAYGDRPLLDGAQLSVRAGERVGLIGRNGTGKSSLLRVIAGHAHLDEGEIQRRDSMRITFVEQEPALPDSPTLRDSLLARAALEPDAAEHHADERERWRMEARLTEFMQRFDLDPERVPATSSGGERKRAALALALSLQPDVLLLDEPTNHLDIQGIEKLEELLLKVPASIVITHDRAFLDRITTRIVELDRGILRSYPGNFAAYEERKEQEIAAEDVSRRRFEKFWAQEEVWIRKGVEARRTRNEGRVKRLERLRVERAERLDRLGNVKLSLDSGERSGQLVAELTDVSKSFGGRKIIDNLSARVMRGDRIGLIGPNGAGKSTLIGILLGTLEPDAGQVKLGTNLQVAYFDQLRVQLDPEATVAQTISPGSDWVEIGSERKHIMSYLTDFLFPSQRAKSPVKMLSGGERNRLLLARLFARPANLVVLDEPTNDLDIESLELLEQKLQDYTGTLLLVSHDRRFLDNVVTQTLAAEGGGQWHEYVGGYTDWLRQRRPAAALAAKGSGKRGHGRAGSSGSAADGTGVAGGKGSGSGTAAVGRAGSGSGPVASGGTTAAAGAASGFGGADSAAAGGARGGGAEATPGTGAAPSLGRPVAASPIKPKVKLSYKDQRELAALPDEIEALEREQTELTTRMSSPDYHRRGPDKIREDRLRSQQIEALLQTKFERWESLEQAQK